MKDEIEYIKMTPLKVLRAYCLWCCAGQSKEVELCPSEECPLYPFRLGRNPKDKQMTALKAIRLRCVDCRQSAILAGKCREVTCDLHPYREGRNPKLAGKGNIKNITGKRNKSLEAET